MRFKPADARWEEKVISLYRKTREADAAKKNRLELAAKGHAQRKNSRLAAFCYMAANPNASDEVMIEFLEEHWEGALSLGQKDSAIRAKRESQRAKPDKKNRECGDMHEPANPTSHRDEGNKGAASASPCAQESDVPFETNFRAENKGKVKKLNFRGKN